MSQPNKSAGVLFDAALELPSEQRADYVREACAGDDALRQRVEALLRAYEAAGMFMDRSAAIPRPETVADRLAEQPGARIGRYKLLQQIGEGGCGVVYLAEQEQPVRRQVALKVIKLGMDTKNVIARFEAERQALALMDHPNIARVLDAGATDTGRPYFVMELVRGIKITDYCDENQLSTGARLKLFIQVCQAVQHAHQKGIIHRDLKPANILVADHDGVPVPKVIDFGIAKATTDQRLTDKTLFTAFEQFLGTPAYMSPEQARLSGLDIDTRSDIYSLGVLLYELLTGRTPFEVNRLQEAGLDEIRRIIREDEPVRPSTRLHMLDAAEQTTVARRRQSDPPKLMHLITGDLDWIVMKALEKDRGRRYETANGLAADVQRHLTNEPVAACPPGNLYKFQKLARRNKLVFVAVSAVVVALIIGLGVSTWMFIQEERANHQTEIEKKIAETEAARARQAQTQSERRLAESLLAQGNALASAGNYDEARSSYQEAASGWQKLGDSTFPAQLALFETFRNSPLPLSTLTGHAADGLDAGFRGDGIHVLSVSSAPTIEEWDGRYGVANGSNQFNIAGVACAVIAYDGKAILFGTAAGTLTFWDQETKQQVRAWTAHTTNICCAAISADGRLCASGAADGSVKCWDLRSARQICSFAGHQGSVLCLNFSADGQWLFSGGVDRLAKVWEVSTGKLKQTFSLGDWVYAVAFSPDGQYALTGCGDFVTSGRGNTLAMWNIQTGSMFRSFEGHQAGISAVAFSPDGRRVLSGSFDGSVKLWDIDVGRELMTFCGHQEGRIWRVAFSADGRRALSGGADGLVQVWPTASTEDSRPLLGLTGLLQSVALSSDGLLALGGSLSGRNSRVMLWDTRTGRQLGAWNHEANVKGVALSPDGRLSLAGQGNGRIILRDLTSGRILRSLSGHVGPVNSVTFANSPDQCLSAGEDGSVRVWDLVNGVELRAFTNDFPLRVVRFSPDHQFVAAAGSGPEITIWQVALGKRAFAWQTGQGEIKDVAWSTDGRRLLSASYDHTFKIWDLKPHPNSKSIDLRDPVFAVVLSQQDEYAFTGQFFGGINVLEIVPGRVLRTLVAYNSSVMSLAMSADRLSLLSGGDSGEVNLWGFSRVSRYAAFESGLGAARQNLSLRHDDPGSLSLFGEWYAFRGFPEWGADLLERARSAGANISPLTLARCYWQMNDLESARREFQRALDRREAPEVYLRLCLTAVSNKRTLGYRLEGDEVVFIFEPDAYGIQIATNAQVHVAGDFNHWLDASSGKINNHLIAWRMHPVSDSHYELRKKLTEFGGQPQSEFKFVVDLSRWIEAPDTALNVASTGRNQNLTLLIPKTRGQSMP